MTRLIKKLANKPVTADRVFGLIFGVSLTIYILSAHLVDLISNY